MTQLEVKMKVMHREKKKTLALTVFGDQGRRNSSTRGTRRKRDKEVMDDVWTVGAAMSRLLIPGSEISFPSWFP